MRSALRLLGGLGILANASVAHADLRSFTHTFEYATMPEGDTAVELWHTQTRATSEPGSPHLYEGMLEIEHGITEHLDVGVFTVLSQRAGDALAAQPLELTQVKVQTRYRIAERGELPIDTMGFIEVGKQFGDSVYGLEARLIGARDFGDVTLAGNLLAATTVGRDVATSTLALGWSVGATYQAHPRVRVGVESWGRHHAGATYADVGPAVSFALAPGLWTAVTAGVALAERDAVVGAWHGHTSVRAIIGIELR